MYHLSLVESEIASRSARADLPKFRHRKFPCEVHIPASRKKKIYPTVVVLTQPINVLATSVPVRSRREWCLAKKIHTGTSCICIVFVLEGGVITQVCHIHIKTGTSNSVIHRQRKAASRHNPGSRRR